MVLTFIDEFNNYDYSQDHWDKMFPWGPYTGGQHYNRQDSNHVYEDGHLSLVAKYEKYRGEVFAWDSAGNFSPYEKDFDYTSAMYYSKRKYKHGYFECRFKVPEVQGTNSAFWLFGEESNEIDVFEILGSETDHAKMTLHWQDRDPLTNAKQSQSKYYPENALHQNFQTMGVLWTENDVLWHFGDSAITESLFIEWQRSRHVPDQELNMILSLDIGTMDGEVEDSSLFPCQFEIDYVSAYQLDALGRAPVILSQEELYFGLGDSIQVDPQNLIVDDSLKLYPLGHKVYLLPGEGYELNSESSFTATENRQELLVNVAVSNGLDSSEVYPLVFLNDGTTGIADTEMKAFRLYPNPVQDKLHVIGNFDRLELVNSLGQSVLQIDDQIEQLDLSGITSGIYFVIIHYSGSRTWRTRVEKL